jgi:hypothetical protein
MTNLSRIAVHLLLAFAGAIAGGACGESGSDASFCADGVCELDENCAVCPTDCGECSASARCGDNNCNGGENCGSCPRDCGACQPSCDPSNDACTGDSICIGGTCVGAFARNYAFSSVSVTLPMRDLMGEPWDFPGGLPDPFVEIVLGGNLVARTPVRMDTLSARWSLSDRAVIFAGSKLEVIVWDSDVSDNDVAIHCEADPLDAASLREGRIACRRDRDGAELVLLIDRI